jgi:cell division septation protein DedD
VVLAVVLAGMLVGAFVWGHSIGVSKQVAAVDVPDAAAPQKAMVMSVAQPEAMKPPYFTLRVMGAGAVMNPQRAQEMADFLRSRNFEAFVLGKGASCTVNVGRFARDDTADAKALKEQIDSLVYRNGHWFTSCSWHKVTAQER